MNRALVVSVGALVLSGLALAFALTNSASESASRSSRELQVATAAERDALERIAELDAEVRALRAQVARLDLRPVATERAPVSTGPYLESSGFASRGDLQALREELRAALAGGGSAGIPSVDDSGAPDFTSRVEEAMSVIRVDEARDAASKSVASRTARLEEALPKTARDLGLTYAQENELGSALVGLYETQANYRVLWETGEVDDKRTYIDIAENDMNVFRARLEQFLAPQQLTEYLALHGDLFPGGGAGISGK